MTKPLHILAISGSLRSHSSNTAVLQAAAALAPTHVTITLYSQLGDLPHFNPDLDGDAAAAPPIVQQLRAQVGRAAGLLICSPEYAHGVPGVLKNALDWLVSSLEFPGKPVALINASARATHAHAALVEILTTMSADLIVPASVTVALTRGSLDATGAISDPQALAQIQAAVERFVQAIEQKSIPN